MSIGSTTAAMYGPRYSGIATFMRTAQIDDPSQLDIALIGVPYDGGVENRSGQRHCPNAGSAPAGRLFFKLHI